MLDIYEINSKYIDYISSFEPHIFHNKKDTQSKSRKYVGIVLKINDVNYFVPLSSYKEKHRRLTETVDFIKVEDYAVLNINNMIPVPEGLYKPISIKTEKNLMYKDLLKNEYRIVKQKSELIFKNAKTVYEHKIKFGENSKLSKRCNDFLKLEKLCKKYEPQS